MIETRNPATGEVLNHFETQSWPQLDARLTAAAEAQHAWGEKDVATRAFLLHNVASILRDEADDHARLISDEMGKPLLEARAEVLKCALTCDFYADHAEAFLRPQPVSTEAVSSFVTYQPIGLVLAIMPWNFPYWQVIRFAAPALAAGNAAVLKHASNTTGSALALQSVFERAGFAEHLFSAVVVDDYSLVEKLIADTRIAAVTLTGSEKAGAQVAAAAGAALKKTVLELGGSDPFVILADADLDAVVPFAVKGRFVNSGQSCLAAKRFIVEQAKYAGFEDRIVKAVNQLVTGDPLSPETQIGPLAKPSFVDDLDRQVHESVAMGARLLTGGHRLAGPGSFYAPTVLADVTPDMPAFNEETFGPLLALVPARDSDHAVELANQTRYGLGASVWSADMAAGLTLGMRIESGALFVNGVVASDPRLPFGGIKLSGYGRELSREGMLEFMNVRTVWATEHPARPSVG
jgi:succinate-semialdehyde dehydrogenase/glutarate-semialdehyde dehydrogenase